MCGIFLSPAGLAKFELFVEAGRCLTISQLNEYLNVGGVFIEKVYIYGNLYLNTISLSIKFIWQVFYDEDSTRLS